MKPMQKSRRKSYSKRGMQDVFLFHKNVDKDVLRSIPLIPLKVDDNESPLSKSKFKVKIQITQKKAK
jgi:hypothetical protein